MITLICTYTNMNTRLEQLFEKHNLSDKNRHEINQIFGLLPIEKQKNLIDNFDVLAFRLEQIEKEINLEKRILVGDLIKNVKTFYNKYGDQI